MAARAGISRASLARLRDTGVLSAAAWEAALNRCGFIPGRREWHDYWRHILLFGGMLLLLSGVIFFIAWNWAEMHRFGRLALVSVLVAGAGAGSVLRGPDSAAGQALLLACGLAVGPLLAVFGQAYQTGSELWELFRVWAGMLFLLALGGRQVGLWFAAWLAANAAGMLWLGRGMDGLLDELGRFSFLPEILLILFLAFVLWEAAAWIRRDDPRHGWLHSRWFPRLLFFDLMLRLTGYMSVQTLGIQPDFFMRWNLPYGTVLPPLYVAALAIAWFWHCRRAPDLFMPACALSSIAALIVCLLIRAEFGFHAGIGGGLLLWAGVITGLTIALGAALLALQRKMDAGEKRGPESRLLTAFFARQKRLPSWEDLWAGLKREQLLEEDAPLPEPPSAAPWYVRAMLAFGGWIAGLLLSAFTAWLAFDHLFIRSHEGGGLLGVSLVPLGIACASLRAKDIFSRHFGFAMALAGSICACWGLGQMIGENSFALLAAAVPLALLCLFMNSAEYRFLAGACIICCIPHGIFLLGLDSLDSFARNFDSFDRNHLSFFTWGTVVCWVPAGIGMAFFSLREKTWRGTPAGRILEPAAYGAFTGAMLYQLLLLSASLRPKFLPLRPELLSTVGLGAGLGLLAFVWGLTGGGYPREKRAALLACAALALPVGYFLPGLAFALFGLALGRHMGNALLSGAAGAFLLAYQAQYYYLLELSLLRKSLLLMASGVLLLLLAFALRHFRGNDEKPEGETKEAAHA